MQVGPLCGGVHAGAPDGAHGAQCIREQFRGLGLGFGRVEAYTQAHQMERTVRWRLCIRNR